MTNAKFNIFHWLTALVILMALPSLWLSVEHIRTSAAEMNRINTAIMGIAATKKLHGYLEAHVKTTQSPKPDEHLKQLLIDLGLNAETRALLAEAERQEEAMGSIDVFTKLVSAINTKSGLDGSTSDELAEVPDLITNDILVTIVQSKRVAQTAIRMPQKENLNGWDRMSVPVQAGQFKIFSDTTSRTARRIAALPVADMHPDIGEHATVFAQENNKFQAAMGKFVLAMSDGKSGTELPVDVLLEAHPRYMVAGLDLWKSMIALIDAQLQEESKTVEAQFQLDIVISVVPLVLALACAFIIGRAFVARTEKEIATVGFYDAVTGLPNRRSLNQTLHKLGERTDKRATKMSVFIVDLRRFKMINQRFGEQTGDEVLRYVADDLSNGICALDLVARTGGNEFTVLSDRWTSLHAINTFAERLIEHIEEMKVGNIENVRLVASVGAASQLDSATHDLVSDASIALKHTKGQGQGAHKYCDSTLRALADEADAITNDLKRALELGHIQPWFQPQVCVKTGRILGVEALARWIDPQKGIIPPGQFLPTADEAGLMNKIDETIRKQALRAVADIRTQHSIDLRLGLNMTPDLLSDAMTVSQLISEIDAAGVPHHLIGIEVLESVIVDDDRAMETIANVERLSNLGLHVELDDFGTGHSSLSSLRDLNVDRVKVDRSFVSGIDHNPELQTITLALTQLARTLNVEVLAEGVESENELKWLRDNHCDAVQGYLIAKPMPLDELHTWIETYQPRKLDDATTEDMPDQSVYPMENKQARVR